MTSVETASPGAVTGRRTGGAGWPRRYLPPQHGAWAMLIVPYLAGMIVAGAHPVQAPLLVAWLAGYLLSYFALQAIKTGRPGRVRTQLIAYAAVTVPAAAAVVLARPAVLAFGPAYAVLLAVNAWYARRRRERALLNDLASVAQSCLMIPVMAVLAGAPPHSTAIAAAVVFAYFTGTVLYVKTMIRERGSVAYRRASVAYHLAALAAVCWLAAVWWLGDAWWRGVPVAVLFAALAVRAWALPRRSLSAKRVGMIEIGFSAALLAVVAAVAALG